MHDITTGLGGGKVLWINTYTASNTTGTLNEVTTPLLNTTGKCVMLFHYASYHDLHFSIYVIGENLKVVLSKDLTSHASQRRYTWWPYYFTLPSGLHWIHLTVRGEGLASKLHNNVIDDLSIRPCEDYKRECLLSSKGLEYMGQVSQTLDGTQCTKWDDVKQDTDRTLSMVSNSC
jgi:hypothetical protein